MALFAEEGMLLCSLRVTRLGLVLFLWICGGCLYYHSSCNLRFVSNCKVSIVGTMWTAEKADCRD